MGQLSSVMATAGAGLLPNPPTDIGITLALPTALGNAISTYTGIAVISQTQAIWDLAAAAANQTPTPTITASTLQSLLKLGATIFPALTNVVPGSLTALNLLVNNYMPAWDNTVRYEVGNNVSYNNNIYTAIAINQNQTPTNTTYWNINLNYSSFSNVVLTNVNVILGSGDLSKFCQVFMGAQGYCSQANATINSVKNSATLAQTFSLATGGMDNLTTGGLNQVASNLQTLGADLRKLGTLINLARLDYLGLPGELLSQLAKKTNSLLPEISNQLTIAKLPEIKIQALNAGRNELTAEEEKTAYTVMTKITGNTLTQVLAILGVTTTGITTMAQLLNPVKILPSSYQVLLCPDGNGLVNVYLASGTVNTNLKPVLENAGVSAYTGPGNNGSLETLSLIIPSDQALANKALARSFQQVKNITATTLPGLSTAMLAVETNSDLAAVNSLTTPVPASVTNFYQTQLGSGTVPRGTILISDVIGVVYSPLFVDGFKNVANLIANVNATALTSVYTYMINTLDGTYDDPMNPGMVIIPDGPAAGTYSSINDAFVTGLLPAADSAINTIANANTAAVTGTNTSWTQMSTELQRESANQAQAEINFGELASSKTSTMSFTGNLHEYGVDVGDGGPNDILTALANLNSLSGQCLISSLREGRNIVALQEAGVKLDTQLSSEPGVGTAETLIPWSQTSSYWSKASTLIAQDRNWGLYRSYRGSQVANWGFDGTPNQAGTVSVTASGKNVDVVIVDAVIDPNHPEFAVNPDGSGGTRVKYYNWYSANISGDPNSGTIYNPPITTTAPNSADDSRHACHVAGTVAGNTQGWAPDANIYNISPQYVTGGAPYAYLYQYILAWHQQKRASGNTNPTICNNSWISRYTIPYTSITSVTYRGTVYTGPFTLLQLLGYGITSDGSGNCIVALSNASMNADIQACINAGIIMVACAGNDDSRIALAGDSDFDNTLTATGYNSGNPIYYTRGSSPSSTSNVICVGAIGSGVTAGGDRKLSYSNCGPRVDLFAPGSYVTSAWLTATGPTGVGFPAPVPDPRNTAYYIAKDSGTSMASPQVAGILACALEQTPALNQAGALSLITTAAKLNQIPNSGGSYDDLFSLQGAPNRYLTLPDSLKS